MDKFEQQFESLDVQTNVMGDAMQSTTTMTTPASQVDALMQEVADEAGIELNMNLPQAQAGSVGIGASTASHEQDELTQRLAKLRQDLECGWFLRYNPISVDVKISAIQKKILDRFPDANNDYLLILMLLRINRYTLPNTVERNLLTQGITRLWK